MDRQLKLGHDVYRAEAAEAARASGGDKQAQAHWPIVDGTYVRRSDYMHMIGRIQTLLIFTFAEVFARAFIKIA